MSKDNLPWALNQAYVELCELGENPKKGYMKTIRNASQSFHRLGSTRERCEQLTERNNKLVSTIESLQKELAQTKKELADLDLVLRLKYIKAE